MRPLPLLLLLAALSFAAPLKHVAVFETQADADSVLNEPELRYLTNELRKLATDELPAANYSVLTRDNIMALLPPDKNAAECLEGQCLVEVGRNIGANYAVQGTVSKFGALLTVTVEAYETTSGKLLKSFTAESPTVEGFLGAMREKSKPVFEAILLNDGYAVQPPAPVSIDPQIASAPAQETSHWNQWVGAGLDVLGAAAIAFAVYQNTQVDSHYDTYKTKPTSAGWKKIDDAMSLRNIGYIAGGVLLAGGLTFHIAF
jgi:hypothetical protein